MRDIIKTDKVIEPDQEYFYTEEQQEKEAQADKDIIRSDVAGPFDNIEHSIESLKKNLGIRFTFYQKFYQRLSGTFQDYKKGNG